MKTSTHLSPQVLSNALDIPLAHEGRYQIYRQDRSGRYLPGWSTSSAFNAVELFLHERPLFEGGDLRLWDHWMKRLAASVKWSDAATEFGFHVQQRDDVFHDRLLTLIAKLIRDSLNTTKIFHRDC